MWDWDSFREMRRMQREVDALFNNNFREFEHPMISAKAVMNPVERFRLPTCDLQETGNKVIATFELPGAKNEEIELNVGKNEIEVKVESKQEQKIEDKKLGKEAYERMRSQFYRRIPLAIDLDSGRAEASYHDGILKVEVPKKEFEQEKKRIAISQA